LDRFQITPSYQTVLETAFDPFASSAQPKQAFHFHGKTSPYHQKTPQNLFMIEPDFADIKSPAHVARSYFPPGQHFSAVHPLKTLRYYSDILEFSKSAKSNLSGKIQTQKRIYFTIIFMW
jgi:hypothetical protein